MRRDSLHTLSSWPTALGPVCFCLSRVHVFVSCFYHFWNDNSESEGCFPVQFLDAHIQTEKQTVEERRWTLCCRCEEQRVRVYSVVFIMCLTLFVLLWWNVWLYSENWDLYWSTDTQLPGYIKTLEVLQSVELPAFRIVVWVSSYSLKRSKYSSTLCW